MVTTTLSGVRQAAIAQSPGQLAPAINVSLLPQGASPLDASWLGYRAPTATFSLGGVSWECYPEQTTVDIGLTTGVNIDIQYYPKWFVLARRTSLTKNLVFLSCPAYAKTIYEEQLDEETHEVLHKESDVRIATGWTLNDIFTTIGERADVPLSFLAPTFHVADPCLILKIGEDFLSFLSGLLPNQFQWLWTFNEQGISVTAKQPPTSSLAFVPLCHHVSVVTSEIPEYQFVEVTGGDYRPTQLNITGGAHTKPFPSWVGTQETIELPEETGEVTIDETNHEEVTKTSQVVTKNWYNEIFAVREQTSQRTGARFTMSGSVIKDVIEERQETRTYDQDDPYEYVTARVVSRTEDVSQWLSTVALSHVLTSSGELWYVTEDYQAMSYADYIALAEGDRPVVLASISQVYGKAQTTEETFSYFGISEIRNAIYEGAIKEQSTTISGKVYYVNGFLYRSTLSPREVAQQIISDVQGAALTSIATGYVNLDTTTTTYRSLDPESYDVTLKRNEQQSLRSFARTTKTQHVTGKRLPGNPTPYLSIPLQVQLDTGGTGSEQSSLFRGGSATNARTVAISVNVPTNNPRDFEAWAGMAFYQLTHPAQAVSLNSRTKLYTPGTRIGGCTISSFRVQESVTAGVDIVMGGD